VGRKALGNGGRFVCLLHKRATEGALRSCYMHLERIEVEAGQRVAGGQALGTVGRTGMRSSAPHLHLELRDESGHLDPLKALRGPLLGHSPDDLKKIWRRIRRRQRRAVRASARRSQRGVAAAPSEAAGAGAPASTPLPADPVGAGAESRPLSGPPEADAAAGGS